MATPSMGPQHRVCEHLEVHPDLLRGRRQGMVGLLMGAEVSALRGASHGERSPRERRDHNGDRLRERDTWAGGAGHPTSAPGLVPPRLAAGTPPASRAGDGAGGRPGRRGRGQHPPGGTAVPSLGVEGISPSLVSEMARELD